MKGHTSHGHSAHHHSHHSHGGKHHAAHHHHGSGDLHIHHHKKGGRVERAKGGRTMLKAAGNPDVFSEAEGKEDYSRRKGGRAKRRDGGKVVGLMTGGAVRPRLDRPGRKRGGRVGADLSPLSSAHKSGPSESEPKESDGN